MIPAQLIDSVATFESTLDEGPANDDPATERLRPAVRSGTRSPNSAPSSVRRSRATTIHESRLVTPTHQQVQVSPVAENEKPSNKVDEEGLPLDAIPLRPTFHDPRHRGVEVAARLGGRLVGITNLTEARDEYILGYPTPEGRIAPARHHLGLRLLKINEDRTVDLIFPNDVSGHLVRGEQTVSLQSLTEGRKYSCLRLLPSDIAAVFLGRGRDCVSYHLRFVRRPASVIRALKRPRRLDAR